MDHRIVVVPVSVLHCICACCGMACTCSMAPPCQWLMYGAAVVWSLATVWLPGNKWHHATSMLSHLCVHAIHHNTGTRPRTLSLPWHCDQSCVSHNVSLLREHTLPTVGMVGTDLESVVNTVIWASSHYRERVMCVSEWCVSRLVIVDGWLSVKLNCWFHFYCL